MNQQRGNLEIILYQTEDCLFYAQKRRSHKILKMK